ncbi:hypothetical protein [Photobacterium leiognathi]|uniref:hypothetical protein n=1 Tax=Photobacterium leiognathi TaxID=553611 RepID=UPI002739B6AC|nr:hypothetical protein [Photobacterium leiognathi]
MKIKLCFLVTLLMPFSVNAIGIDSMMEFTHEDRASFTITNPAEYRQFIQVGISELKVKNGNIESIPYTRDNINDWSLSVQPARTVIDSGSQKPFQVIYDPNSESNELVDKAYKLSFIPTPYFAKGEPVTHSVQVAVGFAPTVIVPAKEDMPISYSMRYGNDGLYLKNNGGTYLRAYLDACPVSAKGKAREKCSTVVYILSGRNLPIELNKEMKKAKNLKVELTTHNLKFKKSFDLMKGNISSSHKGE